MGNIFVRSDDRGMRIVSGSINPWVNLGKSGGAGPEIDGYDAYGKGWSASVIADGEIDIILTDAPVKVLFAEGTVFVAQADGGSRTIYNVAVEMPAPDAKFSASGTRKPTDDANTVKFKILDSNGQTAKPTIAERFSFIIVATDSQ